MRTAFLVLSTLCNRHCAYCFYETGYGPRGGAEDRLDAGPALFSALRRLGADKVILTGGEPLLRPDLEEIVRRAREAAMWALLLTNGDGLGPDRLDRLIEAGLGAVTVSLDDLGGGPGGAGPKAAWDAVERIARRRAGLQAAVITPISRANLSRVSEIIERVHALGLYLLIQPVFIPPDHPRFERLSLRACTGDETRRFLDAVDAWEARFGPSRYAALLRGFYTSAGEKPSFCGMGGDSFVVEADGKVYPCFHRRDLAAGRLLEDDPSAIEQRLEEAAQPLRAAPCFGEHCISLFSHL